MVIVHDVKLELTIEPVYWADVPQIRIEFNQSLLIEIALTKLERFNWTLPADDVNRLSVFFLNKQDSDTVDKLDKAVIIKEIGIEGFKYPSFLHLSQYCPDYSAGYYNYAKENNLTVEPVIHSNYLGFNGEWFLKFTWPTFTWIYETETKNLGWIYEKNI
jgi:hypothetical protein